jgi:REP element-mobilizing transposase RayT
VWRTQKDVRSLRGKRLFRQVRESFRRYHEKPGFRVVHFSVEGTHIHLIVEADSWETLARGLQGLGVSLAKRVNLASSRRGAVFDDRYFARMLRTPRQCANAVAYVLQNDARHKARQGIRAPEQLDAYSSEALRCAEGPCAPPLVSPPESWLLCVGQYRLRRQPPPTPTRA